MSVGTAQLRGRGPVGGQRYYKLPGGAPHPGIPPNGGRGLR